MSESKTKKPIWKKWWFLVIIIAIIAIANAGGDDKETVAQPDQTENSQVESNESDNNSQEQASESNDSKEEKEPEPEPITYPDPIEISGSGDTATDFFEISQGFAVFDLNYQGDRNFIVELKSETGNTEDLLVNTIGSYKGKTMVVVTPGKYLLNIQASGPWSGVISQEIPSDAPSAPHTFEGTGDDVVFIKLDSGMKRFEMSHDGQRNFIVMVNGQSLLVNEIGPYQGSTTETVRDDGIYSINVNADGNWKINIQ